jgi:hypothetical protein
MFFPAPHDAKDTISKFAGFIGMVASIALAVHLILPVSPALSASSQTVVSIICRSIEKITCLFTHCNHVLDA